MLRRELEVADSLGMRPQAARSAQHQDEPGDFCYFAAHYLVDGSYKEALPLAAAHVLPTTQAGACPEELVSLAVLSPSDMIGDDWDESIRNAARAVCGFDSLAEAYDHLICLYADRIRLGLVPTYVGARCLTLLYFQSLDGRAPEREDLLRVVGLVSSWDDDVENWPRYESLLRNWAEDYAALRQDHG